MSNEIGIPTDILFSILGALGVYIFTDNKKATNQKLDELKKEIKELKIENKELSREEFDQVKIYVKESVDNVLNSKEFRKDLKEAIEGAMQHYNNNCSHKQNVIIDDIKQTLENFIKEIRK